MVDLKQHKGKIRRHPLRSVPTDQNAKEHSKPSMRFEGRRALSTRAFVLAQDDSRKEGTQVLSVRVVAFAGLDRVVLLCRGEMDFVIVARGCRSSIGRIADAVLVAQLF